MIRSPGARRWLALAALGLGALAALALALGATARGDPAARLDRALAALERIRGVRFELVANVEASGPTAVAGPMRTDARMVREYQSPGRLHVSISSGPARRELVIVGRRQWVDEGAGYHQTVVVPVGPLRDARAPLTFLRGGGAASFAGLGLAPGAVTYRVRLDLSAGDLASRVIGGDSVRPDARGVIEVDRPAGRPHPAPDRRDHDRDRPLLLGLRPGPYHLPGRVLGPRQGAEIREPE